jgi:predicted dehydrogenase
VTAQGEIALGVIGAGQRGTLYAGLARDMGARVAAVANPGRERRERFADEFGIPSARRHARWEDMLAADAPLDAVIVASPDSEHVAPAAAALERGCHLLLEKPMALDEAGAERLDRAANASGKVTALCHVLRYSPYGLALRRLIREGAVGDVVAVQHFQPIGWWHFAHSFVRGAWRSEAGGSSLLEAMGVHDVDWLAGLVSSPAVRVASFGSCQEFRPERRPAGAARRCVDCPVADACPYSAARIYGGFVGHPLYGDWPLGVVAPERTREALPAALREGPYGECVYLGLNDVVDHQVVTMELASGATVELTLAAFWDMASRSTRVMGSRGSIEGDGAKLTLFDFASGRRRVIDPAAEGAGGADGGPPDRAADGGGVYASADAGLVAAFLQAVRADDPSLIPSNVAESHRTLKLVWAAEQARRSGQVVEVAA